MKVVRSGERRSLSRSATRALDVLEYFGEVRRPLRAVEIARHLELQPSSANQLLKTMLESAHLAFDASTKTYLPSPRLTRFGSWMAATYGSNEPLRHAIAEVHVASGEVVTLTTPNDLFMQVVDLADEALPSDGRDSAERGLRVSMFGSAIGAAYLSTITVAEVRRLAERARISNEDCERLLPRLARVRTAGFADGPSAQDAVWSVATPVPQRYASIPLVLGLAGPADRIRSRRQELAHLLRSAVIRLDDHHHANQTIP